MDSITRFHSRYKIDPLTGCHVWQVRGVSPWKFRYYPQMRVAPNVTMRASHFSLQLAGRPLKPGQIACHRCDNRLCVNEQHLFGGSHRDNIQDCITKGRFVQKLTGRDSFDWTGRKHTPETREKMRLRAIEREAERRRLGLKQKPGRRVKADAQNNQEGL
jgi:hypothetical protein